MRGKEFIGVALVVLTLRAAGPIFAQAANQQSFTRLSDDPNHYAYKSALAALMIGLIPGLFAHGAGHY